jgi:protein SCO1/2
MIKKRLLRTFLYVLIGISIGGIATLYQIKNEKSSAKTPNIVATNFGGAFELTNHLGKTVTDKDFSNQYRLIYFGFTYCPAICPTELQKITLALNELGEAGEKIKPIFITVDPERDTVETMKSYISLFHPNLVGLTGTPEQIEVVKNSYKIYAAKVKDDTMQEYTMDHSSFIYFMGPDDTLYYIFKIDDTAEDIAERIKPLL